MAGTQDSNVLRLVSTQAARPSRTCTTCRHRVGRDPKNWICQAGGGYYCSTERHGGKCAHGEMWELRPAKLPVLVVLKRWLVG